MLEKIGGDSDRDGDAQLTDPEGGGSILRAVSVEEQFGPPFGLSNCIRVILKRASAALACPQKGLFEGVYTWLREKCPQKEKID